MGKSMENKFNTLRMAIFNGKANIMMASKMGFSRILKKINNKYLHVNLKMVNLSKEKRLDIVKILFYYRGNIKMGKKMAKK